MDDWKYEPARDLGLRASDRRRSLRREVGLISATSCLAWRMATKAYLAAAHRLEIRGRENLPPRPPFILVANHASHLDAMILGALLPINLLGATFPIAAGDTFFTKRASSIFATACMNALPIWRKNCGGHSLEVLRERLLDGKSIYILFPEGTRTRNGEMAKFKAGLGHLVAGTDVPVVPCYLKGAFAAFAATAKVPRLKPIRATIGPALTFPAVANERAGWANIAAAAETAVRALAG